jgi:hypothetical protein
MAILVPIVCRCNDLYHYIMTYLQEYYKKSTVKGKGKVVPVRD